MRCLGTPLLLPAMLALALAFTAPGADAVEPVSVLAGKTSAQNTEVDATTRDAARDWGLSVDEIRRYQSLMRGYRGSVSDPRISPIEVLGIHARDDAERRRYAELLVKIMVQDADRILAFERERMAAVARLYPQGLKVLDYGKGDGSTRPPTAKGLVVPPSKGAGQ